MLEQSTQIKMLNYAEKKKIFTATQLKNDLSLSVDEMKFFAEEASIRGYFTRLGYAEKSSEYQYMLSFEGMSRLLEYEELVHTRKASQEAKRLAIAAIIISLLVGAIQLLVTQDVRIVEMF